MKTKLYVWYTIRATGAPVTTNIVLGIVSIILNSKHRFMDLYGPKYPH